MATITATPNPVFVHTSFDAGETTLNWNTESTVLGRVWQSIDEGLGYGPDTLLAPPLNRPALRTGTVKASITVGKAYLFKLKDNQARTLASVAVTAQQTTLPPMAMGVFHGLDALVIPVQRIMDVVVDARPDAVRIRFSTAVATVPIVEINRQSDFAKDSLEYVTLPWGEELKKSHSFLFEPLLQRTKFFFRITAGGSGVNPDAKAAVSTGEFTTGTRFARVTVREIEAVKSGDSGDLLTNPEGTAEWSVSFRTSQDSGLTLIDHRFPASGYASVSNGEILSFPFGTEGDPLPNIGKRIVLAGRVYESDKPDFPLPATGLETKGFGFAIEPWQKQGNYGVFVGAGQEVVLPDNAGRFSLDIAIDTGDLEVHFILRVRIDVSVRRGNVPLPFVVTPLKPALVSLAAAAGTGQMMARGSSRVAQMTQGADRQLYVRTIEFAPETLGVPAADRDASNWRRAEGQLAGPIIALPPADGFIDLVATGADGSVLHASFRADEPVGEAPRWQPLRAVIAGGLTALRAADGTLQLFGLGPDGSVQHGTLAPRSGDAAARWRSLGGRELRGPIAVAEAGGELHVFAAGRDGGVVHRRGGGAAEWDPLGERSFSAGLAAGTAYDGRTLVLFGFDVDRTVYFKTWNDRKWVPSQRQWTRLGTVDELDELRPPPPEPASKKQRKSRSRPARSRR